MTDILGLVGVVDASSLGDLLPAFKIVQQMATTYESIKFGQKRCKAVIRQAALVLKDVHNNRRGSILDTTELQKKFEEIQTILQRLARMSFFKALLHFEDINNEIERANQHLAECSQIFRIDHSSHIQALIKAAVSDQDVLRALLTALAGNYEEIRRRFSLHNNEQEDLAMAVIERELRNSAVTPEEEAPVEVQIMQRSLECMKTTTGRSIPKQSKWLIAEYDLDFSGIIGGGGFSTVSKAYFRGTLVAVKTLKDFGDTRAALEREIEIWSALRHDHIVPFYGACTLTSPPYIVSRYMQNGNLVQYLVTAPHADRTKLIFQISLGMYYLHVEGIVHGDLKGVNVLVDDAGKACITDFGLSKVYSSWTAENEARNAGGTIRFLAPEVFGGQPLSFETDVYAFGMVIYEVFTGEVPFIREPDHMIREGRLELHRPTSSKVYERGLNDIRWQLLVNCTSREPSARPHFKMIQAHLSSMKTAELTAQSFRPDPTLGTEKKYLTDWGLDTKPTSYPSPTWTSSTEPLLEENKSVPVMEQPRASTRTTPLNLKTLPPILPMCIVVTHKYFDVKFGISSGRPDICLDEASMIRRRVIKARKGTLSREVVNKFWYKNSSGSGENSWELDGTNVKILAESVLGVCHFRDAQIAQKWFRLQRSYARNGSVDGNWPSTSRAGVATVTGDWSYTERSWRRLVLGKIQLADLVEGAPKAVPIESSWSDIVLPKHYVMGDSAETKNSIVCVTKSGKFCCKCEGCMIIYETYRQAEWDGKGPIDVREETYPSEGYAEMTFDVLRVVLGKGARKSNKWSPLSF